MKQYFQVGAVISLVIILIIAVFGSAYTIDQTERGIVLRNGKLIDDVGPGFHLKIPMVDEIKIISLEGRKIDFGDMSSYSKDQQTTTFKVSVNYHVPPDMAKEVYSTYKTVDNLESKYIYPKVPQQVKTVFGKYDAAKVIQDRESFNLAASESVKDIITDFVIIDSVQVENVDFSDAYEDSIEKRMLAEVAVQEAKQNWEKEKIQADIARTKAQASADAIVMAGKAEATAINAKGQALRDNPGLVPLTLAERWDGALPTMMTGNTVPFIDVSPKK